MKNLQLKLKDLEDDIFILLILFCMISKIIKTTNINADNLKSSTVKNS